MPFPSLPTRFPAFRSRPVAWLTAALLLAVAGCASGDGDSGPGATPEHTASSSSPAPGAAAEPEAAASSPPPAAESIPVGGALHHVHGIVVVDDDSLLLGTHTGVVSLSTDGTMAPVGEGKDDHMGMSGVPGTDRLVSSGHPGVGSRLPNPLGFMTSDDGGATWTPVSLTGEVDFHALATDGALVVGYDGRAGLLTSDDGGATFTPGASIAPAALAIRDGAVYATTAQGVQRSTDGGRTFSVVPDAPLLVLLASGRDGSLWGVDVDGFAWRSVAGEGWARRAKVGPAEALGAHDAETAYAVRGSELLRLT